MAATRFTTYIVEHKDIYPSLIMGVRLLEVQMNAPWVTWMSY